MLEVLHVFTVILVAMAMVPAVAHALELPGKMRLTKDAYVTTQSIYYPGFTVAGISEPLSIIFTIIQLVLTPPGSSDFWLTLAALFGLIGMQAVYWLRTHPVNKFWVQGKQLGTVGADFFSFASGRRRGGQNETLAVDWTELRDRWEYSHVMRAALVSVSFIALVVARS